MTTAVALDLGAVWRPQPTQATFLAAIAAAPRWAIPAYVGSFGSGKTFALCRAGIGLSLAHPGIVGLLGRFNATDLRDTTQALFLDLIQELEAALRAQVPAAARRDLTLGTLHKSTNDFEWANGSRTLFRPLEEAERKYKSLTLGFWGVDEASEIDRDKPEPSSILMLQGRLRQLGMPCVGFMVSNPTGFEHWLYRWYGAPVTATTGPKGYAICRAKTAENAEHLPPGYLDTLRASYPPDHIKRYLEGEWGGLDEGLPIYPTFRRALHVRTCTAHPRREVQVGIDLGTEAPGVVWTQIETRAERLVVLRSWAPRNIDIYQLAAGIKARTGEWFPGVPVAYFTGHDGGVRVPQKGGPALPAREVLREVLGSTPASRLFPKERGFTTIRSLLERRDDGEPGLLVDPANVALIDGFDGGYRYDPKREGEPVKNGVYDPVLDALRYIATQRFTQGGRAPAVSALPAFRGLSAHPSATGREPGERIARRSTLIPWRQGA